MADGNTTGSSLNSSTEDYDQILQDINDKYARILIPVVLVFVVLMILGLFGNPLVIYFYGFRLKPTASYMFIVSLAVFDLITCLLSMPLETLDVVYFYTFPSPEACRVLRFVNYFSSIASGTTLIAISVDRYRKICKPFNTQITVKKARFIILGVMAFALFSSWPSIAIYKVVQLNITDHEIVKARDCRMTVEESYQNYIIAYQGYLLLCFVVVFTFLLAIYINVGRKLYHLRKFEVYSTQRSTTNRSFSIKSESTRTSVKSWIEDGADTDDDGGFRSHIEKQNTINTSSDSNNKQAKDTIISAEFVLPDLKPKSELNGNQNSGTSQNSQNTTQITDSEESSITRNRESESRSGKDRKANRVSYAPDVGEDAYAEKKDTSKKKLHAQNINTQRYTIIAISISFAFILSYLPYLILTIWTIFAGYDPYSLSAAELVFSELFHRSFLFNSVCNPMIYGLLNSEFKQMVWDVMRRVFCCGRGVKKATLNNQLSVNSG